MQPISVNTASKSPLSAPTAPQINFYHQGRQSWPVSNLVYMQADANYSWLVWTNGQRILMPRTLKHYESLLPVNGFVRLHRNYSVNIHHVVEVQRMMKTVTVKLSNGLCLTVARRRWTQIKSQFYQLGKPNVD